MQKRVLITLLFLLAFTISVSADDLDEFEVLSNLTTTNQVNILILDENAMIKIKIDDFLFETDINASTEDEAISQILNLTNLTLEDINNVEVYRLDINKTSNFGELKIKINRTYTEVEVNANPLRELFNLTITDREEVMNEIFNRTNLTSDDIDNLQYFKLRVRRIIQEDITPPGGGGFDGNTGGGDPWSPPPEPIDYSDSFPFEYPSCREDDDCNENEICVYTIKGYYKQCIPQETETIPVLSSPNDNSQPPLLTGFSILDNANKDLWAGLLVAIIVILLIISGYLYLNKK